MTKPLALVVYEKLLPGTQLANRLQDMNYRVQVVGDSDMLEITAVKEKPMLVLADLESRRRNVCDGIARLKKNPETQHLPVIAFAPDADQKLQTAGRATGATMVVSDTAIIQHLPQFLEIALQVD